MLVDKLSAILAKTVNVLTDVQKQRRGSLPVLLLSERALIPAIFEKSFTQRQRSALSFLRAKQPLRNDFLLQPAWLKKADLASSRR